MRALCARRTRARVARPQRPTSTAAAVWAREPSTDTQQFCHCLVRCPKVTHHIPRVAVHSLVDTPADTDPRSARTVWRHEGLATTTRVESLRSRRRSSSSETFIYVSACLSRGLERTVRRKNRPIPKDNLAPTWVRSPKATKGPQQARFPVSRTPPRNPPNETAWSCERE